MQLCNARVSRPAATHNTHEAIGQPYRPFNRHTGRFTPDGVATDPRLKWSSKDLYSLLAKHNGKSGACFPKVETLAREMGVSVRTVHRGLAELVREAYIRRPTRKYGQWSVVTEFLLHPRLAECLKVPPVETAISDESPAKNGRYHLPKMADAYKEWGPQSNESNSYTLASCGGESVPEPQPQPEPEPPRLETVQPEVSEIQSKPSLERKVKTNGRHSKHSKAVRPVWEPEHVALRDGLLELLAFFPSLLSCRGPLNFDTVKRILSYARANVPGATPHDIVMWLRDFPVNQGRRCIGDGWGAVVYIVEQDFGVDSEPEPASVPEPRPALTARELEQLHSDALAYEQLVPMQPDEDKADFRQFAPKFLTYPAEKRAGFLRTIREQSPPQPEPIPPQQPDANLQRYFEEFNRKHAMPAPNRNRNFAHAGGYD